MTNFRKMTILAKYICVRTGIAPLYPIASEGKLHVLYQLTLVCYYVTHAVGVN